MKRETINSEGEWFLGIMAYAILLYLFLQPEQFMKMVEWLARLIQK